MKTTKVKKILKELENIISDRSNINRELLEQSLELMKDIIYSTEEGIYIYDVKSNLLWENNNLQRVFGYTKNKLAKSDIENHYKLYHPKDLYLREKRENLKKNGNEFSGVVRMRHVDGRYIWVRIKEKIFLSDSDGSPLILIGFFTNVTKIITEHELIKNLSDENKILNFEHSKTKISQREKEVLKLIAEGFSGKEIADKLNISFHTVRTHRRNLLRKLSVRNSAELVSYFKENIYIE